MDDLLISQFIDDELDLDEKIAFVEATRRSHPFAEETLSLLSQERLLREQPPSTLPASFPLPAPAHVDRGDRSDWQEAAPIARPANKVVDRGRWFTTCWPPLSGFAAALLLVGLLFLLQPDQPLPPTRHEHRFVLYQPGAQEAKLAGSFTDWRPLPMERVGDSSYWTLTVPLPAGEHRYSFLVEGDSRIADPTVVLREQDDFGGENSLLVLGDAPLS